ncbi:MAG: FixH family protein [Myxococcota bacterium]
MVGILGGSVLANVYFVIKATGDPSFAIEKDYYQKAVAWDDTVEQNAASAALGWDVEVETTSHNSKMQLGLVLVDDQRRPIHGADVTVRAFAIARSNQTYSTVLSERDGRYEGSFEGSRPGLWELVVEARLGSERFEKKLRLEHAE